MRAAVHLGIGVALLVAAHLIATYAVLPARADAIVRTRDVHDALTPGEFAGTLMLGGFRGLATDLLWMRALSAKEEGRYYESLALCETIARVQPRFEQIWEFMSWDLAYNIGFEMSDEEGKWAWYVAGLRINARGCARNPGSERLLRHLAWLFHHKGDYLQRRVEATDFAALVDPLIAEVDRRARREAVAPLPAGGGQTAFTISTTLYRACIALAEADHLHLPAFVRRMVPMGLDRDGNLWRNRGEHRRALARWLDAIDAWPDVVAWHQRPPTDDLDQRDKEISRETYERNEGRLRRKAAFLARRLAPDAARADAIAAAIDARDTTTARALLAEPGWHATANNAGVHWLDEDAPADSAPK